MLLEDMPQTAPYACSAHAGLWWDKVLAWELDPRLIVPNLPEEHQDVTFLFIH